MSNTGMFSRDFFIFEMANNHQGDVLHGKAIIKYCSEFKDKYKLTAGIKFQLRNLDTFIEEEALSKKEGHIRRFLATKLSHNEFEELSNYAKELGLYTIATVFDEESIPLFKRLKIDILKIASCSANDYPLLEKLSEINVPTIISTAGLSMQEIVQANRYLGKSPTELAIMHCVAKYPSQESELNLRRINEIKNFFPLNAVGFSTHEDPKLSAPIIAAKVLGATIFEKHVALETNHHKKNLYSADKKELEEWIINYQHGLRLSERPTFELINTEKESLLALSRGLFNKNGELSWKFPCRKEQFKALDAYRKKVLQSKDYVCKVQDTTTSSQEMEAILDKTEFLMRKFSLPFIKNTKGEISHHYGSEDFTRNGCVFFFEASGTQFHQKKILMFQDQQHPMHMHQDRTEFFFIEKGRIEVKIGTSKYLLNVGDSLEVPVGQEHSFRALEDSLISETIYMLKDKPESSIYKDPVINYKSMNDRKKAFYINENKQLKLI